MTMELVQQQRQMWSTLQLSLTDWPTREFCLGIALAFSIMLLRQYAFLYLAGLEYESETTYRSSVAHVERREEVHIGRIIGYIHYQINTDVFQLLE